ncbi:DMT family transporter [Azospirillum thermophilum]|uniref:EamA-like transporter family protein n=1 Tax=Azospirillum thermophilum TaxID=2202148 RepID=A0A2S2CXC0_9PROT|nr:DMT family transporter [Azospirillum thermophilum]AWK89119.1 hypothetical protein DEW08_24285 [Azospirillum thermophilum]
MTSSASLSGVVLAGAALVAGAAVPFQAGANAALGRTLGHPLWATVASLIVSLLAVLPSLLLLKVPAPSVTQAFQMPLWVWFGGIAGVVYITSALLITPRLGATAFIVCVIAGQVLASLLIDHFGLMGLAAKPASAWRVFGVLLIVAGMVVVMGATTTSPSGESKAAASQPDTGRMAASYRR